MILVMLVYTLTNLVCMQLPGSAYHMNSNTKIQAYLVAKQDDSLTN
jgi:hypothetical protein